MACAGTAGVPEGERASEAARPGARARARGAVFLSGVLFGLMAALARLGSRDGTGFTGPQMTAARFGVSVALTLGLFRLRPGTFRPVRPGLLAVRGVTGGLSVLLYFVALTRLSAGLGTLLNNLYPVFATAIAAFTIGERPTVHLAGALAVVSAGVALVVMPAAGGPAPGTAAGWAVGVGVLSGLLGGVAVTSVRALRADHNAPTIFFAFAACGFLVSLPFCGGAWPTSPGAWALALGVGTLSFAAQLLTTHAYGALTVPEAALWQGVAPMAGYGWGLLLLGERISGLTAVGVLAGVGGVAYGTVLGARGERSEAAAAAPPPR